MACMLVNSWAAILCDSYSSSFCHFKVHASAASCKIAMDGSMRSQADEMHSLTDRYRLVDACQQMCKVDWIMHATCKCKVSMCFTSFALTNAWLIDRECIKEGGRRACL